MILMGVIGAVVTAGVVASMQDQRRAQVPAGRRVGHPARARAGHARTSGRRTRSSPRTPGRVTALGLHGTGDGACQQRRYYVERRPTSWSRRSRSTRRPTTCANRHRRAGRRVQPRPGWQASPTTTGPAGVRLPALDPAQAALVTVTTPVACRPRPARGLGDHQGQGRPEVRPAAGRRLRRPSTCETWRGTHDESADPIVSSTGVAADRRRPGSMMVALMGVLMVTVAVTADHGHDPDHPADDPQGQAVRRRRAGVRRRRAAGVLRDQRRCRPSTPTTVNGTATISGTAYTYAATRASGDRARVDRDAARPRRPAGRTDNPHRRPPRSPRPPLFALAAFADTFVELQRQQRRRLLPVAGMGNVGTNGTVDLQGASHPSTASRSTTGGQLGRRPAAPAGLPRRPRPRTTVEPPRHLAGVGLRPASSRPRSTPARRPAP